MCFRGVEHDSQVTFSAYFGYEKAAAAAGAIAPTAWAFPKKIFTPRNNLKHAFLRVSVQYLSHSIRANSIVRFSK